MKDMFSAAGPFEMGAWAPDGWGFLTPEPRDPEDVVHAKGFAKTGWGQLAVVPEAPAAMRPQYSKVLFGQSLGQEKPTPPGKVSITYEEATTFLEFINIVLAPLTPEEREAEGVREACKRELQAGSFPILKRLQERLGAFVEAGDAAASLTVSKGELTVLEKAISCAEAAGRGEAMKKVLVVGGGLGAAALLFLLL